ncbi:MAG: hypothetical protein ACRCSU_17540 [Paracoccaceae bacterium]
MPEEDDALETLRRHNDELVKLLADDGRNELDRLVLLELALHAYTNGKLQEYADLRDEQLAEILSKEIGIHSQDTAYAFANNINSFMKLPEPVKNLGKKIGSVANSYVKKKAGGILGDGGDDDADD